MEITKLFKSKTCWLIMSSSLILTYFILKPQLDNMDLVITPVWYLAVLVVFALLFSLAFSCSVRISKLRWQRTKNINHNSLISAVLYILGIGGLQTCFLGGFCGVNLFVSFLAIILPSSLLAYFIHYSIFVIVIVNFGLLWSLWSMNCFKKANNYGR